jgi:hypothetical protein
VAGQINKPGDIQVLCKVLCRRCAVIGRTCGRPMTCQETSEAACLSAASPVDAPSRRPCGNSKIKEKLLLLR